MKPEILAELDRVLKAAIAEQVAKPLADLRASLGELDGIGAELAARLNQASALGASGKEPAPEGSNFRSNRDADSSSLRLHGHGCPQVNRESRLVVPPRRLNLLPGETERICEVSAQEVCGPEMGA